MNISFNDQKTLRVSGKSVRGVYFSFNLVGAVADQGILDYPLNLNAMTINIVLKRLGKEYPLCNGQLHPFAAASMFEKSVYSIFTNASKSLLLADAADVYENSVFNYWIDFRGVINLAAGDELIIDFNLPSAALIASASAANSSCQFNEIDATGFEEFTPSLKFQSISPGESIFNNQISNDIVAAHFINKGKYTILTTDQVVQSVSVASDLINYNALYSELIGRRFEQLQTTFADANLRAQSFCLVPFTGIIHDKVGINLNLVSANVASGNNSVVYTCAYVDERLMEVAAQRAQGYINSCK